MKTKITDANVLKSYCDFRCASVFQRKEEYAPTSTQNVVSAAQNHVCNTNIFQKAHSEHIEGAFWSLR